MKYIEIKSNFKYPVVETAHRQYGANLFVGEPLREDGDWRPYLPLEEDQRKRGVESSACYIEAQQHCIATIEEETYGEKDNNYSSRFNALLSGGSENGGDPLKGGDSIRHDGLIPDYLMPFDETIESWDDFHSWKGVDEIGLRVEGAKDIQNKTRYFGLIIEKDEPIKTKYLKLRNALKYCPCPVSVAAWYEENGTYVKPFGSQDNHLVELVYIDKDNRPYIRDTYPPYQKVLEPYYNFDFSMGWVIVKKEKPLKKNAISEFSKPQRSFFVIIVSVLKAWWHKIWK